MEKSCSELRSLQVRWLKLSEELRRSPGRGKGLAGPFLSVPSVGQPSILLVGKATFGPWNEKSFLECCGKTMDSRILERQRFTTQFIQQRAKSYGGGFWPFARQINKELVVEWKTRPIDPLQHVTWTNICKVGTAKGNPRGRLLECQRDLAIETLRCEIQEYSPKLVWFVTWDFCWDIVKETVRARNDETWDRGGNEECIWSFPADGTRPPVLLTGHPERRPRKDRRLWIKKALDLISE
jgi:hypothetical protein